MHFTREPIVETIITPKEGHKLAVRNTKGGSDEHMVTALEVVSIGNLYFLRSLEKPKAFLLPFSDYEILEVREVKMAIKSTVLDQSIKIGKSQEEKKQEGNPQKKKRQRRSKKKEQEPEAKTSESKEFQKKPEAKKATEPKESKPRERKKLVPPPTTLISETISRYKKILLPEKEKKLEAKEPQEKGEETKKETLENES
ncbi:MAG: hypothetical protein K940chlam8_00333 [Chlamydiae bacterium]|nr:hypothetical protein [Chlamydiota bacterium]